MNRSDQDPLHEAIELSRMSIELGGGPFGAVVVHDGVVVGRDVGRDPLDQRRQRLALVENGNDKRDFHGNAFSRFGRIVARR